MKKIIIAILLSMLPCVPMVQAQNGIYVTLASGFSFLNGMPSASAIGAAHVEQKNFPAFRGSVGYVHQLFFSRVGVGFEIGKGFYSSYNYRMNDGTTLKAASSTLELLSVFRIHLIRGNFIYTKLGGIRNTMSVDYQGKSQQETRIQPMISLGIIHGLFRHIFLDVSYNISFGQNISSFIPMKWKAPSTQTILAGIGISFF